MRELSPIEWAVLPLKKYAVFSGRAPRAEYWWFYLATVVASIPLSIVDQALAADWGPLSSLFSLLTLVPSLAVTVRRLHDTNRSGWWLLWVSLPLVLIVVAMAGVIGAAMAGSAPAEPTGTMIVLMIVAVVALIILGITMLVFMVTPGTEGPNDYGEDPYGPDSLEEVFA